jgi:hypothetical protein
MNEDEIRGLFQDMRDDPLPADSLARIRAKVERRTLKPVVWLWPRWALAGGAVLAAAVFCLLTWKDAPPPLVSGRAAPPLEASRAVAPSAPLASKKQVAVRRHAPARTVRRVEKPKDGILIRIETPDPDVVILLLGDGD